MRTYFLSITFFVAILLFPKGVFAVQNVVLNGNLETVSSNPSLPSYWSKGGTGANTRIHTYPVTGNNSLKAAKVEITSYTDGDAKWYFNNVAVIPGETYNFSDDYLSNTTSFVTFRYQLSDGTFKYPDLEKYISSTGGTFTPFSKNFTVPTNYGSPVQFVTMFHLIKSVGSITVDNASLTYVDLATPTVTVTGPTQTSSGTITLTSDSSDNVGVAHVSYFVDTTSVGDSVSAPFSLSFDTTTLTDGTHQVIAKAYDDAGNIGTSASFALTVQNGIAPTTGLLDINETINNTHGGTLTPADTIISVKDSANNNVAGSPFSSSAKEFVLSGGTYTVIPNTVTNYTIVYGGDCSLDGNVGVVVGETHTCTVTFNDLPPPAGSITVHSVVINNNGGTANTTNFPLFIDTDNIQPDETIQVSVGAHVVGLITDPNYERSFSGDCDANGNISVTANGTKVCTITNDDIAAAPPIPPQNVVPNPSVETASAIPSIPQSWIKGGTGTNTRVLTYPVAGYSGVRGVKTEITSYTNGDAKWYFDRVQASSGQQYTFSDYYLSTTTSYVTMQYGLSDGTYKYADIALNLPPHSTWTQVSATFTIPTYSLPVINMTVFHLIKSVGSLTVDNYSLATYIPPPSDPDNLIPNPSVETASGSNSAVPANWAYTSSTGITATASYPVAGQLGNKAVRIDASAYTSGAGAKWYFQNIPATAGQEFRYSDYYQSTANSFVTVQFLLQNGTYQYMDLARLTPSSSWKKFEDTILIPPNVQAFTVLHILKAAGSLTTDNYSLKQISGGAFATGMVTLNFDDGLQSVYDNALPILHAAHIKSSHYIITHDVGDDGYMTAAEVLTVNAQDGNEIGAHTLTHPYLTQLTLTQAQNQIAGSKADLAAGGATPNTIFVYPYGDYNDAVRQLVIDSGFIGARTVHSGYNTKNSDKFALRDQHVEYSTTPAQIESYIDYAMTHHVWLILEFHDTNYSADQYSNTPETLQEVANYLVATNIPVVTTAEGIALMN